MLYDPEEIPWHVRLVHLPIRALQGLAAIGAWLVWPIDTGIHWVARFVFGAAESLDIAEYGVARVLWVLLSPLRLVRYVLAYLFHFIGRYIVWPVEFALVTLFRKFFAGYEASESVDFFFAPVRWAFVSRLLAIREAAAESTGLPRLVLNVLAAPLHLMGYLTHACIRAFMVIAEFFTLDAIFAWTFRFTRPIWYPCVALGGFFVIWSVTRTPRQLAWGIPAMVVLMPVLWIAGENVVTGNSRVAEKYRAAVNQARRENDMERMYLYERKLQQLGVDTQSIDFYSALRFAQGGKFDEAYQRMCRLAPEERPGHANAHIWIIQSILSGQIHLPPEDAHRKIGAHLKQLESLGVTSTEIELFHACWLAADGQDEKAAQILKPVVHLRPSAAIDRMRLNFKLNHLDEARQDALIVEEYLDRKKIARETITSSEYQWWAVAEEILNHRVRLRAVVADWLKLDPKNEEAIATQGKLLVQDLDDVLATDDTPPEMLVETIQNAFAVAGTSPDLKQRILQLYRQRTAHTVLGVVFNRLLHDPALPATLAETLGTAAATDKDWNAARPALERAVAANSENAVAWNNLAFVLLQQGRDYERALAASNRALRFSPDNFHLRETRGQILVKLKRWDDAVADLEFALNGMPDAHAIHNSLALSYEALGNQRLSAMHRQMSN